MNKETVERALLSAEKLQKYTEQLADKFYTEGGIELARITTSEARGMRMIIEDLRSNLEENK